MNAVKAKAVLTQELLKTQVIYDSETGIFTRAVDSNFGLAKAGDVFGFDNNGYLMGRVFMKKYYLHKLAWFYVHGVWSSQKIDHRDGVKTNNRIDNLRDVSIRVNNENARVAQANSQTQFLGVTKKPYDKYQARISVHGRRRSLGYFKTPEEAHAAYVAAKRVLHEGCTI